MHPPVPWRVRIAYAMPALALAVVGIPLYVYIPRYYTDVVGVDIAVLGYILLGVRLFDALSDPVIGALSDRTRTRFGRRRPWILFGVFPLTLALVLLFSPPELSAAAAPWWFGITIFAVFLCWTLVTVPYESLGPEISFDYDERTTILGLRDGLLITGTVLAAASPAVAGLVLGSGEYDPQTWTAIAVFYAPLLVGLAAWCVLGVPERPRNRDARPMSNPLADAVRLLGNRPFTILLASYTIASIGSSLPATLITFYVAYVIGDPSAAGFLLLYFVTGVVFLPAWVWLSGNIGKKPAWIAAAMMNTVTFAFVFFLGEGDVGLFSALVVLSGVGFGATLAIPSAMQADVIDYEELRSGHRREGEIIGVWAVARKLAAAFGVGIALPILGWIGYVEGANTQPEDVQLALRVLYAVVPSTFNLIGLAIALWYPINRDRHEQILAAIEARKAGRDAPDPLAR